MKWGMEVKCRKLYQLPLNQSLSDIASDMGLEAQVIDFIGRVSALQQHLPLDTPLSVVKDFGIKYVIYTWLAINTIPRMVGDHPLHQ